MYVCGRFFFGFDLGRNFYSISLKLDIVVGNIENWTCIVFGPNRPKSGGAGDHVNSRIFDY